MAQKRLSEATKRRLKAGRMLLAGKGCAEVALAVDVARQTVYTWKGLLDEGGIDALRAVPERGRPAQLNEQQLAALRATLLRNPIEQGFGTELWTLKRVGAVIERMHGVRFGQTQIWLKRPDVFHGTYSMTCANSVLPTFMRYPRSSKPESIANAQFEIQIVDIHESLATRAVIGFAPFRHHINRTLLKRRNCEGIHLPWPAPAGERKKSGHNELQRTCLNTFTVVVGAISVA